MTREAVRGIYIGWGPTFVVLAIAVTGRHPYGLFVFLRQIQILRRKRELQPRLPPEQVKLKT